MRDVLNHGAAVAAVLLSMSCAFEPPEGRLLCERGADCPSGWVCQATRCYSALRDAGGLDASSDAAFVLDASTDAAGPEDAGPDDAAMVDARVDAFVSMPLDAHVSPDSAARADAGPTCTTGPDDHCYLLIPGVSTWTTAGSTCAAMGGHLVTIASTGEQAVAWTVSMPSGMPAWIGATDEGTEGSWRWTTAESWIPRWGPTQPDNSGGAEHCAVLWPGFDGSWADVSCASAFPAVCELP